MLDPAAHDCPWGPSAAGIPCGCDWHVDGGLRGYKMWATLRKDASAEADGHAGIVIMPLNAARRLCEVAARLNATMAAGGGGTLAAAHLAGEDKRVMQHVSDANGHVGMREESTFDVTARELDAMALEGASCVIEAVPGDVLLFYPGVFHRSQDVAASRVAIIAEAM